MVSSHVNSKESAHKFQWPTLGALFVGPLTRGRTISWIKRLEIAEDAAKGS